MRVMRTILFLLLPLFSAAQNTSAAVSDSIRSAMVALVDDASLGVHDTIIQPLESFYTTTGRLYVYVAQVAGGQFKALCDSDQPNIFKFNDPSLVRAWHIYEIYNWLTGETGTNYSGYGFTGSGTITCTLTISSDTWTGVASNETDALGLAFYHFLIDPDFETYQQ